MQNNLKNASSCKFSVDQIKRWYVLKQVRTSLLFSQNVLVKWFCVLVVLHSCKVF